MAHSHSKTNCPHRSPSDLQQIATVTDRHGRDLVMREKTLALNGMSLTFEPIKHVDVRSTEGDPVTLVASFCELPFGAHADSTTVTAILAMAEASAHPHVQYHAVGVPWNADHERAELVRNGYGLAGACGVDGAKVAIHVKSVKNTARKTPFARAAQVDASAGNAPAPEESTWSKIPDYFGFSGFGDGDVRDFVKLSVRVGDETVLSIPGASGDVAMTFPADTTVEQLVVADINQKSLDFASARVSVPQFDVARRRVDRAIRACPVNEPTDIANLVQSVSEVFAGVPIPERELADVCREVIADYEHFTRGDAIVNRWAPLTTIGRVLGHGTTVGDLTSLMTDPEVIERARDSEFAEAQNAYERLLLGAGREHVDVRFEKTNLFQPDPQGRRFDLVLVWEAALMASSNQCLPEFVNALADRVAEGGQIVLTGVRGTSLPAELVDARRLLTDRGFVVEAGFLPLPSRPRSDKDVPRYPFVVATDQGSVSAS